MLSDSKMTECEVSLRAAFYLLREDLVASDISVAIDGAQVKTGNTIHFPLAEFMRANEWIRTSTAHPWRGSYRHSDWRFGIEVHSTSGRGDVVSTIKDGRTLRAESKKGPLFDSASSSEYPLMREALGQLLTIDEVASSDLLAVIVPSSRRFDELASRWRRAPLITRLGVQIWTVHRNGTLAGVV